MNIKKAVLALIFSLSISNFACAVPFVSDYSFEGVVVGYVSQESPSNETPCYVAIKGNDSRHSGYYHAIFSQDMCQTARLAYVLKADAKIWGVTRPGNTSNAVAAFELHDGEVIWWK